MTDAGRSRFTRSDATLAAVAIVAMGVFAASLSTLWPLVDTELTRPREAVVAEARQFLEERGVDIEAYRSATVLTVDADVLDYAESTFGRERVQRWIARGVPFVENQVGFKKPGEPRSILVWSQPSVGPIGYRVATEDDDPGERPSESEARGHALAAIAAAGIDIDRWNERAVSAVERPERRDHVFTFERHLAVEPELRERLTVVDSGGTVTQVRRELVLPGAARRAARAAEAPGRALESLGLAGLAVAAVGAFFVFLTRLRSGTARIVGPALVAGFVFACLVGTWLLQTGLLFRMWEPLWPRWLSSLQYVVSRATTEMWMTLVLLALVAAGDALDRESGARRGETLWKACRGRLADPDVGLASFRGLLVGFLCGGALAASIHVLQWTVGATTSLQPRGFFFYALNAASPTASTLLFFLNVALLEELGYRFFAGAWIERLARRRWLAILIPALIYGATHARLDFLPGGEPFWARAAALTVVGCVWGWAFFRYDALTVVLSHWTADLFIFNWPRLASDRTEVVVAAAATIAVPALPALLAAGRWALRRRLGSRVAH